MEKAYFCIYFNFHISDRMKNVIIRAMSGTIYVGLIVAAILCGKATFISLTAIFSIIGCIEFHKLTGTKGNNPVMTGVITAVDTIGCVSVSTIPAWLSATGTHWMAYACIFIILYGIIRVVMSLYDTGKDPFMSVAKSFMSVLYVASPMALLNLLYLIPAHGQTITLIMFVMIWLNDTGAYCIGSLFGKHRLCQRLSPKKSWEGFWGGMSFCVITALLCAFIFNDDTIFPIYGWVGMGVVVSVFSTWGDLFESMMKRSYGVKDSGNIIPGHGGILDRIDSLLLVSPALLLYVSVISSL